MFYCLELFHCCTDFVCRFSRFRYKNVFEVVWVHTVTFERVAISVSKSNLKLLCAAFVLCLHFDTLFFLYVRAIRQLQPLYSLKQISVFARFCMDSFSV